jgi:hypothetical protein
VGTAAINQENKKQRRSTPLFSFTLTLGYEMPTTVFSL